EVSFPVCGVSGCGGGILAVDVDGRGRPVRAYVSVPTLVPTSAVTDACMTKAAQSWVFLPAKDCDGQPVASVWDQSLMGLCTVAGIPSTSARIHRHARSTS